VKSKGFDLSIATSKYGVPFVNACGEIAEKWKTADNILVEFGAPARGLFDIAKDEGLNLSEIADFIVNTIPEQSTETVRTEEALIATLAILNVHFGL
jgi:predicted SPOUT superfamily RNA methylase MTH1